MKLTDLFVEQLKVEANRTRRVLEQMPEGRDDWKPHDKSMILGSLANMVATMPSTSSITMRELSCSPKNFSASPAIQHAAMKTIMNTIRKAAGDCRQIGATSQARISPTTDPAVPGATGA